MRNNRLGCFSPIAIITALITLAVIVGTAYARGNRMFSSGALNAESGPLLGGVSNHAEIGGECGLCHTAPWDKQAMAERCQDCHVDIASDMTKIAKAHGEMNHNDPNLSCMHCHPEHRGPSAPLTLEGARAEFPHAVTGYVLKAHTLTEDQIPFVCEDCHAQSVTNFDPAICVDCHRGLNTTFTDAHLSAWGSDCLACHDGVDTYNNHFDHGKVPFALMGAHVTVDCYTCHATARALVDLKSTPTECVDCHQDEEPHQLRFGADCLACHTVDAWTPSTFDHNISAFKLDGKHVDVKCDDCHEQAPQVSEIRLCADCHAEDDEHDGMFTLLCGACHKTTAWDDSPFDHNKSQFPLTGKHVGLDCALCHKDLVFKGTPDTCVGCHGYPGWHGRAFGPNCLECHTTDTWYRAQSGPHPWFSHPREGGVGMRSCRSCHPVSVFEADCSSCHKNGFEEGGGGGEN